MQYKQDLQASDSNYISTNRYHTCLVIENHEQRQRVQVVFNDAVGLNETYTSEAPYNPISLGNSFLVGSDDPEAKKQFFGKMADFNVWNRSLTRSEILEFTQHCSKIDKTGKIS